jgi:hypothetical protein
MTWPKVSRIWFGSSLTIKFPDISNPNFIDWLFDFILDNEETVLININIAAILYNIWFARNLHIFEEKDVPEEETISIEQNVALWNSGKQIFQLKFFLELIPLKLRRGITAIIILDEVF